MITKNNVLVVFFILILQFVYANAKIDSLKLVLKKVESNQKAIVLNQIAEQYRKQSVKDADTRPITMKYAKQALEESRLYADKQQEALALYSIATIYKMNKDMEKALVYYNEAQTICIEINDQETLSICYSNIGLIYYTFKSYPLAIEYYKKSVAAKEIIYADEKSNSEKALSLGKSILQLGNVYKDMNKLAMSYEYYSKAMQYFRLSTDTTAIAVCYNNQGNILYNMSKPKEALSYYKKALQLHQKIGNYYETVDQFFNIGIFYFETKQYDNALNFIQKGIHICIEIEDPEKLAYGYTILANIYANMKNFNEAKKHYELAISIAKSIDDEYGLASMYLAFGSYYFINKKYSEARDYYYQSYELSKKNNSIMDLMNVTQSLYIYYDTINNKAEAYTYFKLYQLYKDSIGSTDAAGRIAELQLKSKIEQQETELKHKTELRIAAEHRTSNIQNFLIFIFIIFFISSIFFFGHITLPKIVAEGVVFFTIVISLEFIMILLDPFINGWSHGMPAFTLLANIVLTLAIFPAHSWFEKNLKRKVLKIHQQGYHEHDYAINKILNINSVHTI